MSRDPERSIETLLRLAGEREAPSPEATERAREAAQESWQRMLADKPRALTRFRLPLAFAAAVGVAVLGYLAWPQREVPTSPGVVARIVALDGAALLHHGDSQTPATLASVWSDSMLQTREGRAAVLFADALSLRMDRNTQLRFDGRDHVTLLAGGLYVDSGGLAAGPPLTISTPAGDVRHLGTQFQVLVSGESTRVRVREGRVTLQRGADHTTRMVAAGDQLEVRKDGEHWQHGLASFGEAWEWSANVAPALAIEDRPLAEFLAWMAREHGWQLHYADEALQQRVRDIRLHGSLENLSADAMLERVALVTGVPLEAHDGVLWVGASRP